MVGTTPTPTLLYPRQIWAPTTTAAVRSFCTPLTLPTAGVLFVNESFSITLTRDAVFEPECTGGSSGILHGVSDNATVTDWRDPFYASVSPQVYALAAATVISYVLVIMLFITPRTFFVGGPGGGAGFLSSRVLIGGSNGRSSSIIGVGRRPWLQKIAALSVAASLTIATADTFKVAERQYLAGFSDSDAVVDEVAASLEIRVVRVISDTFLWLAQVQTLIRLFPRHKEKVVIKWLGFALIVFDTLFSILNSFVYMSTESRPRSYQDAVPALSYLFELAIGLIYASCIIYYSISKRRFAFFHPKMRNICLVALLSITAVLIPVVFFILDITKPDLAGWGDYVRWVGAAAASVVVWEWVERIEALERDERKDGILGREIFDGDEMLETTPSEEVNSHSSSHDDSTNAGAATKQRRPLRSRIPFQGRTHSLDGLRPPPPIADRSAAPTRAGPPTTNTPISRADTTSAASTQYAVRYHTIASPSPPPQLSQTEVPATVQASESSSDGMSIDTEKGIAIAESDEAQPTQALGGFGQSILRGLPNPFKKRKASPPAEVADAMRGQNNGTQSPQAAGLAGGGRNLMNKITAFTFTQKDRLISHLEGRTTDVTLPITIIPAQTRGHRTWSPQDFERAQQSPTGQQALAPQPRVTLINGPHRQQSTASHTSGSNDSSRGARLDSSTRTSPSQERGPRLISRRGTLTFCEDEPRVSSASPQHSQSSNAVLSPNTPKPQSAIPSGPASESRPSEERLGDQGQPTQQEVGSSSSFPHPSGSPP